MQKTNLFFKLTESTIFIIIIYRIAQVGFRIYNVFMLKQVPNGNGNPADDLTFMLNEFKTENVISNIVIISWFIFFSIWLFASYKKVQVRSTKSFSYKPTTALFSLIIPVFNLFAPYKIMTEIWTAQNRDLPQEKSGQDLINTWWFLSIALFVYSRYCNYKSGHAQGTEEILKVEYYNIVYYLVSVHYFITLKKLITLVNQEQNHSLQETYQCQP